MVPLSFGEEEEEEEEEEINNRFFCRVFLASFFEEEEEEEEEEMNLADADGIDVVAMEDDDDEEEEPHDVITYVDQKALLRKQKYTEPTTGGGGASNVTTECTRDFGKKKKSVVRGAIDRKRGGKRRREEEEEEEDLSTRRANELGAIHEGNSNDHGFANEGFQGFRDSSGFGLWGGGNESVDGTTTMTTMTTKEGTISTTTPTRKNTIHANSLDGFERRTSPRVHKTTGSPAADNRNNTSAVAVRRSPRKHKGSMDGPSTQTVSSPNNNNTNITKTKKKATTIATATTKTTRTTTTTTTSARTMARAHANQKKRSAKETNTAVPSKKGKIIKTKTAARGGRAHQSQRTNVRKTALVMTSTQQQQQPSQYNKQIPSSNRGTIPTTTQARQQRNKPKQTTGGAGRKDNVPSRTPIDSGRKRPQLPRAMLKMPTSTRDEVLGVVKPASVIEKVRYIHSKKNDSVDGTQSSLGNGMEEIEDDIVDSGDDEDDGVDETNVDVVALPENAVTTQTKGNDDVGTPTPTKGGEEQILEEKEKKKVTSFLPKFASPTNDLFLDGGVDGGGKKFKRGTEFTGSGPKARLKRALQKLKNNKLRFEENIKKNRLEYDEGSSRENGVTFHVRSLTMERGIFRCFGHAKPMSRKKTEAEVIGDILEDDDEEENLGEDKDDFIKRKENKELHDLLDDNGEYDVTVLFTKELQKELNVSIGNRVEIFQPFHEVLARNVFGETTRCIIRADFCRVLEGS